MSGTSDKISGKIKQVVGSATNDKELEAKGKIEETKGKVKDNLKHAVDKISTIVDDKKSNQS